MIMSLSCDITHKISATSIGISILFTNQEYFRRSHIPQDPTNKPKNRVNVGCLCKIELKNNRLKHRIIKKIEKIVSNGVHFEACLLLLCSTSITLLSGSVVASFAECFLIHSSASVILDNSYKYSVLFFFTTGGGISNLFPMTRPSSVQIMTCNIDKIIPNLQSPTVWFYGPPHPERPHTPKHPPPPLLYNDSRKSPSNNSNTNGNARRKRKKNTKNCINESSEIEELVGFCVLITT